MAEQSETPSCPQAEATAQEGVASWYGDYHHGQQTASGAPYDMDALTAAHPDLPIGSRIRVTNRENGRSVELTVNDRGPIAKDRIIDVSSRAARELGFARSGIAPVRIERADAC